MLKLGTINNCEKCGASYSKYDINNEKDSDWKEYWCEFPERAKENEEHIIIKIKHKEIKFKKPKGLCQFCNPVSIYYIDKKKKKKSFMSIIKAIIKKIKQIFK